MSSLAFLLLLSLSCHACTARPLRSTSNEIGKYRYDKDLLDKVDLLGTLAEPRSRSFTLGGNLSGLLQDVTNNYKTNIFKSCGKASSTANGVVFEASGTEVTTSSDRTDMPYTLKTKGMRRRARSMLGPAEPQHHAKETVAPNTSGDAVDVEDDIVEKDYAQPHRKPPIHNEKP